MDLIVEDGSGLATANSYASVAEADDYHDHRLHSQLWQEADDYKKQQALAWASDLLDRQTWWLGTKATSTQGLQWPRADVLPRGELTSIPSTTIPRWLKWATAELARQLLERDRPVDAEHQRVVASSSGGRSRSLGQPDGRSHQVIPPSVVSFIAPYSIRGVSPLVRAA